MGRFLEARLLDNQEGANTERYVFGSSRREVSNTDLGGTGTIPTVEISTMAKSAQGGVVHTVLCEYGALHLCCAQSIDPSGTLEAKKGRKLWKHRFHV